jgi:WD40 repeat protein/energy-coupling factor transporter ATP-binding protein EcfA2
MWVTQRLRIFVSSPGDVAAAREVAALTIERLAQDYARFVRVEPYLWEFEAMVASGHFQDSIEPPSAFDVVVLIVWSRLGTLLPKRTAVREYRGIDGRCPVTGTEWEFEEALHAAQQSGAPDLLVYRNLKPALFHTNDPDRFEQQSRQLKALNGFWERHFASPVMFLGAYTSFSSDAEFAAAFENHLRRLIEKRIAAPRNAPGGAAGKVWTKAPFRGLESYEFEHAPIFFGQDQALAKAMLQLSLNAKADSPFLLVLGASGSGKSSLVKAGIVAKLFVPRRVPGAAFLRRVVFRPSDARDGEDLFDALARRLTTPVSEQEGFPELIGPGQSLTSLAAHLRDATGAPAYPIGTALGQLAAQGRMAGRLLEYESAKLVLVVDQLEELFTIERITAEERRLFLELLAGLVRSGLVWIIATMRLDFWHRAAETPELVHLAEGTGRLELLPPDAAQLSQMIRRPAEAAGLRFEVHSTTSVPLNELISQEVAREPGALPLLSYLLDQMYRTDVLEAQGDTLTYATFENLGRLEGAIATKAEAVLERCAPEDRQALGSVLYSLVEMGTTEGNIERAVARRVPLATFPPGTAQRRLVETLLDPDARLLVSDAEQDGNPMVRVAHEALISRWEKARDFVQSNSEALKVRHRIEGRYAQWRGLGAGKETAIRTESAPRSWIGPFAAWRSRFGREHGLLSDIDLTDGRRLLREHRSDTESDLIAYIERSIADDRRIRSRSVRLLAAVAATLTLLVIIASGAGLVASKREHEAQYQAAETIKAQSRLLMEAAAQRLKDGDVAGAQGIILELLTNPQFAKSQTPAVIGVFQQARATDTELAVLFGHSDIVTSVAFSPDGARVITGSYDNTARIWDARSGIPLALLSGHSDHVSAASYSPDGSRIITASWDRTARIWDVRTGALLKVLSGHGGRVLSATYSPDGTRIATVSDDKTGRIWDARLGTQIAVLSGHSDIITSVAFSPDGTRIVTAANDRTARIWDAHSGAALAVLSGHGDYVTTAAYSPDGTRIVTASWDKTARIWDARLGTQLAVLLGHGSTVFSAAYSHDGTRIVTASHDGTARIWDARLGTQLTVLSDHANAVQSSAAFSPDGTRVVTGSFDNIARIWDVRSGAPLAVLFGHGSPVETAAYSHEGTRITTGSFDKTARIWDARLGTQLVVLSGHGNAVDSAAFSPDGTHIVTASHDKTARIWDAISGALLMVLSGHRDPVITAAYSPDGARIVTASFDKTARIWDARLGKQLAVLAGHGDHVTSAAYSPDGSRIVTASWDKTARIWDARLGTQLAVLSGHSDILYTAAYSPDGTRIVTASHDRTARIWDARSGAPLVVLSGHNKLVETAAFSPDGTRIVTASDDDTVRIWDARLGTQLAVLLGHSNVVNSAAYSPDGTRIVTASDDKTARVWNASVPATLDAQIAWDTAAQFDALSNVDRTELGLPADPRIRVSLIGGSACDQAAAAFYDPDRRASGASQSEINADVAEPACAAEAAHPGHPLRLNYQWGRTLLAKHNVSGARRQFELAVSKGYRAAGIDLGNLLADRSAGIPDPERAERLYEKAWRDGVTIAAFALGHLYETGVLGGGAQFNTDAAKAWGWYQKGADAGEPTALARFAEREERNALGQQDSSAADAQLLQAFRYYAAAAERAHAEDWPDEAWRSWRYRRATLARLLARKAMMSEVAKAYSAVREQRSLNTPTLWEKIEAAAHK